MTAGCSLREVAPAYFRGFCRAAAGMMGQRIFKAGADFLLAELSGAWYD
jgi:hypothetical protein